MMSTYCALPQIYNCAPNSGNNVPKEYLEYKKWFNVRRIKVSKTVFLSINLSCRIKLASISSKIKATSLLCIYKQTLRATMLTLTLMQDVS